MTTRKKILKIRCQARLIPLQCYRVCRLMTKWCRTWNNNSSCNNSSFNSSKIPPICFTSISKNFRRMAISAKLWMTMMKRSLTSISPRSSKNSSKSLPLPLSSISAWAVAQTIRMKGTMTMKRRWWLTWTNSMTRTERCSLSISSKSMIRIQDSFSYPKN